MIKVAVVGATGYAGAELVRILSGHPQVELSILTSRQFADLPCDGRACGSGLRAAGR